MDKDVERRYHRMLCTEVRRRRTRRGWSQDDLAAAMRARGWRWSQSEVSRIEKGERVLTQPEAWAVSEILGITQVGPWVRRDRLQQARDQASQEVSARIVERRRPPH